MKKQEELISKEPKFEFVLRNKEIKRGILIKEYLYRGVTYLKIKSDCGKNYLINPKKAKQI